MGFFGDSRQHASGGNWLRLDNGDTVTATILAFNGNKEKTFDDGKPSLAMDLDLFVFDLCKAGDAPEDVNEERKFDPTVRWCTEILDLADRLASMTGQPDEITRRYVRITRADRPGKNGFRYGWLRVLDLGPIEGVNGPPALGDAGKLSAVRVADAPAPQAPAAPRAPQAPAAPRGPQAPAAPRGPQAPAAPRGPQAPAAPRGPQAPAAQGWGYQAPDNGVAPGGPDDVPW
jgi:pyruvate/2-oxoglutarate dehydrogenase complex dihydrolipoamide acyltransferase (E2) component